MKHHGGDSCENTISIWTNQRWKTSQKGSARQRDYLGLLTGQIQIAGTLNVFGYDVILEVEDTLHQAAKASPQWHTHQDSIQRMSTTSPSRLNKPGRLQNTPGTPREKTMPRKLF
jgi:hypothetical protein